MIIKELFSEEYQVKYKVQKAGPVFKDTDGLTWTYIPATVFDNPYLTEGDKSYVRKLKSYNEKLRDMWLHGSWDSAIGMFFDHFDTLHHEIDEHDFVYEKDWDLDDYKIYRGYDYGTKAPFVCVFLAVDRKGFP